VCIFGFVSWLPYVNSCDCIIMKLILIALLWFIYVIDAFDSDGVVLI